MTHRTRDRLAKTAAALDLARTTLRQAVDGTDDRTLADAIRMALADLDSVRRRVENAREWTRPARR